jgi:4'-phosphopantetheinyl transferase
MPMAALRVWSVAIDRFDVAMASHTLSPEERERADRFRHDGAQRDFIVMRHVLRRFLADLSGKALGDIEILLSGYGKPWVENGPYFSLSHSGDRGLVALSWDGPIGVDIEIPDRLTWADDPIALARTAFHPAEVNWLASVPAPSRRAAFFAIWCRREALLKAAGVGIAVDPGCLQTDLNQSAGRPVSFSPPIVRSDGEWRRYAAAGAQVPPGKPGWWVRNLDIDGTPAALAGAGDLGADIEISVKHVGLH